MVTVSFNYYNFNITYFVEKQQEVIVILIFSLNNKVFYHIFSPSESIVYMLVLHFHLHHKILCKLNPIC